MNSLREFDDTCHRLAQTQARLFERSSHEGLPSAYFAKVFMHSEYADKMDDLSYIDSFLSSGDVYSGVERSLKMDRGMVYSPSIMHWAGYFYRAFAYLYELRSPWLFKQIPLSYLASVYPAYHSLDIRKAILNVIEAKGLSNYENDLWKRTLLALRKSINRV